MKYIYISLCIVALLASCSSVDPIVWNNDIVSVYDKTIDGLDDFEEFISLETVGDTLVNKHIKEKGDNILIDLDKAIKKVSEGEIPSNGEKFQNITLGMLESVKEQVNIGLKFVSFSEETTEPVIEEYAEKYDKASRNTALKVDSFTQIQKQFAESNGFDKE